jgi:hypothetical protein
MKCIHGIGLSRKLTASGKSSRKLPVFNIVQDCLFHCRDLPLNAMDSSNYISFPIHGFTDRNVNIFTRYSDSGFPLWLRKAD